MKFALVILSISVVVTRAAFCPGEKRNGKICLAKEWELKKFSFLMQFFLVAKHINVVFSWRI